MIRLASALGTLALVTTTLGAACSSTPNASDGFGSSGCNVEHPAVMAKFDPVRGCFDDPAPVVGVCNGTTSEGEGFGGLACAFAADGAVYAEMVCENCGLSGAGFRYSQFVFNGDMPPTPAGEEATDAEVARCAAFDCVPLCSNGQPYGVAHVTGPLGTQCGDAGASDAGPTDAARD